MATLEKRGDSYRVIFYYQNVRFTRSLKTDNKKKAEEQRRRLEGNLDLLEHGRLAYEPGKDDLPTLLLTDGRLNARPEPVKRMALGEFFDQYKAGRSPSKERSTVSTEDIHIEHIKRIIGARTALVEVPSKLQHYVTVRSSEIGRGENTVSEATVRKELSTLSSMWNRWGNRQGLTQTPLSLRNLEYKKGKEKSPFQTFEQIQRKIAQGASTELWESVFLSVAEIDELLAHVKSGISIIRGRERHFAIVYPMFVFCAHTGARRSEMLRSRREDFDFERNEVTIREKKKDRSKVETYRQVPMSHTLRDAMQEWFAIHPGGPFTFSKEKDEPVTDQMAQHHFRWALERSKWEVIRGWHALRHSFISNLASKGIDQRIIMGLAGHLNAETTKRYAHLFPSTKRDAVKMLFS